MLNALLERYWNEAYAEGMEGRDHDTDDWMAQRTLTEIHAEVMRMIEAERDACANVCEAIAMKHQQQYGTYAAGKKAGALECMEELRSNH